jgi:hypothetical protein
LSVRDVRYLVVIVFVAFAILIALQNAHHGVERYVERQGASSSDVSSPSSPVLRFHVYPKAFAPIDVFAKHQHETNPEIEAGKQP